MGKLVVTEFVSLDGVAQAPGGEEFKRGRIQARRDTRGRGAPDRARDLRASRAWPNREGEFADKFNTMPKYVVSSTLEDQVEQHDGRDRRRRRRGQEAQGADRRDRPDWGASGSCRRCSSTTWWTSST